MTLKRFTSLALLAATAYTLQACEKTVQPGDETPPVVTIGEIVSGGSNIIVTTGDQQTVTSQCRGEDSPGIYHLKPDQDEIILLFSATDASGIRSMGIAISGGTLRAMDPVLPVEQRQAHGGNMASFHVWDYHPDAPYRSPALFALKATPHDNGFAPITLTATDGAGNSAATFFLLQGGGNC